MTAVYRSTDFLKTIKENGLKIIYNTLMNANTKEDYVYTFFGKVIMTPRKSNYGSVNFGININQEQVKFVKELSNLLKFPITEEWSKTLGLTKTEDSMFFKIHDSIKHKTLLFEEDFSKWEGKEVKVKTKINVYFNAEQKVCGLYYSVVSVEDSSK